MTRNFKLQPVLDYRQILEDQARQRLTGAIEREQALVQSLMDHRARLQALGCDLDRRQREGIAVADLLLGQARIEGETGVLKNLERELEDCGREIIARRQELCAASRDKELLERLKEKAREERRQHEKRLENIRMDELSAQCRKEEL